MRVAQRGKAGLSTLQTVTVAPGVILWRDYFSADDQRALLEEVHRRVAAAPFYRPVMPGNAKPFSVEQTNFGPLGWVSDKSGYRYQPIHPLTRQPWPDIPDALLQLWRALTSAAAPQCCLVNFYRFGARMGLHQDRDETADAPVVSVSLGDTALFRIGGTKRGGATRSVKLSSGDVLLFGGEARLAFHGIDRILPGSSTLIPGGGRLNLTLRRVD